MFRYADLYMRRRPPGIQTVVLNIYGGEALHHPDILAILDRVKELYQPYASSWKLTTTTTTNAIVSSKKLAKILPSIDEFTVSFHTESSDKQKQEFKQNLLAIQAAGRRLKCIVLMHNEPELFAEAQAMIAWLEANNIRVLPRQLDDPTNNKRNYNEQQVKWFDSLYQRRSYGTTEAIEVESTQDVNLSDVGRACCGGRQVCLDQNYKERTFFVMDNKFTDWYCSVNWFFLYVKQVFKEVYVNKDCKMNFDGSVGPIGTLDQSEELLTTLAKQLDSGTVPVIQCKKYNCFCGLCAPKAQDLETYNEIITKYQRNYNL